MGKIGNYFLKLRNKYFHKNRIIERSIVAYPKATKIGVLFHLSPQENHQALNKFIQELIYEGKQVTSLAFFDSVGNNPYNFQFDFFQKKDISNLGNIQSEQVSRFMLEPFDYLFCITTEDFSPFDTIMMDSVAKCRVGLYQANKEDCFDVMIELPENKRNIQMLLQEALKYTKLLTKKT